MAIRFCQAAQGRAHTAFTPASRRYGLTVGQPSSGSGAELAIAAIMTSTGREMLYLLSFYMPRFLRSALRGQADDVVHELWHIGPDFDGDLRSLSEVRSFRPTDAAKPLFILSGM